MKGFFTRLLRRKLEPEPKPEPEPRRYMAAGDIIGRQGGQKRNRVHIYRQPFGGPFPIRLCDWLAVDTSSIERVGEAQGLSGPAEAAALDMALNWAEVTKHSVICKHCRAIVKGKRGPLMGAPV